MKKKIVITLLAIISISIFIITLSSNNNKNINKDGIKLAISDGNGGTLDSIPAKGMYKVKVTCTNAEGSWDYINWQIIVKNVSGDVKCNLEFKSISTTYLNTYITGLAGTTQGTGEVVHEIGSIDNSYVSNPQLIEINSTNFTITQGDPYGFVDDSATATGAMKNTNQSQDNTNSIIELVPKQNGAYQICYTMSSEYSCDYGIIKVNGTQIFDTKGANQTSYKCLTIGNLTTSDTLNISYKKDGSVSNGTDTFSFYLQKGTFVEEIVTLDTGYRYEGKNPNNYVWFNDELWRIIGVFDSNSHGQSDKNLVKIIRADSIGGIVWNKTGSSDWPNSSLKALLNGAYYDWDSNSASAATNCYGYSSSVAKTCDYSTNGIKSGYRSMIENVTWYLGGGGKSGYTTYTPDNVYSYERNSDAIYNGRIASTTGYIGLMYESDYLYAVLSSNCARTRDHLSISTAECSGSNWLYNDSIGYEWTITPNTDNTYRLWTVNYTGAVIIGNADNGYAVRPVLYLASNVYKIDGDGSKTNPYIIGM